VCWSHICIGAASCRATSAPATGPPPRHVCTGTGRSPAIPAPGLRRDCHICTGTVYVTITCHVCAWTILAAGHICAGTALIPAMSAPGLRSIPATSAPGLFSLLYVDFTHPLPHLRRDCAQSLPHLHQDYSRCYMWTILTPCHICAGTALSPATSAPGLFSLLHVDYTHPLPHLRRDRAQPSHICPRTGLSPLPHLHRDCAHPLPHLRRDWARPLPPLHWNESHL
jgi:hypothetical protein